MTLKQLKKRSHKIYHNEQWIDGDAPLWSARDRVRYGDGIFDTMLCVDGELAFPEAHYARLTKHCAILGLPCPFTSAQQLDLINDLLAHNDARDGRYAVNTIITRGVGQRGLMPPSAPDVSVTVTLAPAPAPHDFPPLRAITAQSVRRNEGSPLSRIKSCNYGDNILALREAADRGCNEAFMLNNTGDLTCASAGNVLVLLEGSSEIYTPPLTSGAMDGIIRAQLLEAGCLIERTLNADDLTRAKAVYITNSIRGIMALISLDGRELDTPPFADIARLPSSLLNFYDLK